VRNTSYLQDKKASMEVITMTQSMEGDSHCQRQDQWPLTSAVAAYRSGWLPLFCSQRFGWFLAVFIDLLAVLQLLIGSGF
jgi:hypothetical protein